MLIVGLGNVGTQYEGTRHNAGAMVLDRLGALPGHVVLRPSTFMNLSGAPVLGAMRAGSFALSELLVIHDELDFEVGTSRLKLGGGHGGHNGVRSIIEQCGAGSFARLRVGIGRPSDGDVVGYVLGVLSDVGGLNQAAAIVRAFLATGVVPSAPKAAKPPKERRRGRPVASAT